MIDRQNTAEGQEAPTSSHQRKIPSIRSGESVGADTPAEGRSNSKDGHAPKLAQPAPESHPGGESDDGLTGSGAAHTPAPWEVGRHGLHDFEVLGGTPCVQIAVLRGSFSRPVRGTAERVTEEVPVPEAWANAALIAAAPALLEALLTAEWAGTDEDETGDLVDSCPNCGALHGDHEIFDGLHTPTCELRDALDAALGVSSPRMEVVCG